MELSSIVRTAFQDTIGAATGTSSEESRLAYAQDLRQTQKAVIQCLNTSYGGSYLFGGTSTKSVPFALSDDGTVTYRGVPVNGGDGTDETGKTYTERLAEYEDEAQYVDLGFGLNDEADGMINDNSAFNLICNATTFLGTGTDDNGNSQNLVQLLGDLADALDRDEMTYDDDYFQQLSLNFEDCMTKLTIQLTQFGSEENLMSTNESRLDTMIYNLAEKTNSTEYISEAEAITNFQEAQYTYKAALQIGTKILSQSFLDYMG
jgi:flagellar hook-associated protein 3 FlgL